MVDVKAWVRAPRTAGFTMVEMVIVIVLVGILSAVALPKFFNRTSFDARGYFDESLAATRYAQKLAIASGCDVAVNFSAGGYALMERSACTSGAFSVSVPHPARTGGFRLAPPDGVSVGSASLYFDKIGRPRRGGALLTAVTSVAIGSRILSIEPQTGYVH